MPYQICVETFGGPEMLRKREISSPALLPGQIRVQTRAIGVNRADLMMRSGNYHIKTTPLTPGLEASGVVTESNGRISRGSHVVIFRKLIGLYASELIVDENDVFELSSAFDLDLAASLPVNWLSAYHSLFRLLNVKSGESVFISAATSAVGQAAMQLALNAGLKVIAGVGSFHKLAWLKEHFPSCESVHYSDENLTSLVLGLTDGKGVDTAIDLVGGSTFRKIILALKAGGRLVQAANVTLADSQINVRDFYSRNISILGFQYGNLIAIGKDFFREDFAKIVNGFECGRFRSLITSKKKLEDASDAHRELEDRNHLGKIILVAGASR